MGTYKGWGWYYVRKSFWSATVAWGCILPQRAEKDPKGMLLAQLPGTSVGYCDIVIIIIKLGCWFVSVLVSSSHPPCRVYPSMRGWSQWMNSSVLSQTLIHRKEVEVRACLANSRFIYNQAQVHETCKHQKLLGTEKYCLTETGYQPHWLHCTYIVGTGAPLYFCCTKTVKYFFHRAEK